MASSMGFYAPNLFNNDGNDFQHRERVATHYQSSAVNKSRLRYCIFFHYILFFVMLAKLSADILDHLNIFILEIEELQVPQPLLWEYIWASSLLTSFLGISAMRKNKISTLKQYMIGITVLGVGSILYGFIYYFNDVYEYLRTGKKENIHVWQDLPYGMLWYSFILAASQVHGFTLYFSYSLLLAWQSKRSN